jgi:hypothetical protein
MFRFSVQITAGRHAIKSDCGVGHASGGVTPSDILGMVGDRGSKSNISVFSGMLV